jgi:hypothetical protein
MCNAVCQFSIPRHSRSAEGARLNEATDIVSCTLGMAIVLYAQWKDTMINEAAKLWKLKDKKLHLFHC